MGVNGGANEGAVDGIVVGATCEIADRDCEAGSIETNDGSAKDKEDCWSITSGI